MTALAEDFDGPRLNSANDATVRPDGTIFINDPDFGLTSDYEGHRARSEIGACNAYRITPETVQVTVAADEPAGPNVVLSADERYLYVSNTLSNEIRVFAVDDNGTLSSDRAFAHCSDGSLDNISLDDTGHHGVAACVDGAHCYAADGTLIAKIRVPEIAADITIGGAKRNRTFHGREHNAVLPD